MELGMMEVIILLFMLGLLLVVAGVVAFLIFRKKPVSTEQTTSVAKGLYVTNNILLCGLLFLAFMMLFNLLYAGYLVWQWYF